MKKALVLLTAPFCHLACELNSTLNIDALYLTFYSSHDASRVSAVVNDDAGGFNRIDFHNQKFEPSFGISASYSYQGEFSHLLTQVSGLFFETNSRTRTHYYPGETGSSVSKTDMIYSPTTPSSSGAGNLNFVSTGNVIEARNHLNFNLFDLSFAPQIKMAKKLTWAPAVGAAGLISNTKNSYDGINGTSPDFPQSYSARTKFNGVGPLIGAMFNVGFTRNLNFDISAMARFMFGHKKGNIFKSFPDGPDINHGTLKQDEQLFQADYSLLAKFSAKTQVNKGQQNVGVSFGYRLDFLPKYFVYAYNGTCVPDEGIDLIFQALTAGAFIQF